MLPHNSIDCLVPFLVQFVILLSAIYSVTLPCPSSCNNFVLTLYLRIQVASRSNIVPRVAQATFELQLPGEESNQIWFDSHSRNPPNLFITVSLHELLVQQFDPSIDAQQAELELESYKWNPMDKKGLGIVPFRGHMNRRCARAGKTTWALKGKAIRCTFPDWLTTHLKVHASEDDFWNDIAAPK